MSLLTIPNVFVNGATINAAPFNVNFAAITTWSTNIDNTNIGTAGLFPSQLIPTTAAQATVGGSFGLLAIASGTTAGQLPPVYTNAGAATAGTEHIVRGQASVTVLLGQNSGTIAVAFTGAAQFTSGSSYYVLLTPNANLGGNFANCGVPVLIFPSAQASTGFTINLQGQSSVGAAGQTMVINYLCIGS